MAGSAPSSGPRRRPELRAVLFDAGGTLIHMPRTPEEILADLCRAIGLSISLEQAQAAYEASERFYVQNYLGYVGDHGEFWLRYHGAALRHLGVEDPIGEKAAHLSHGFGQAGIWQPYPEADGVCRRLRSMGLGLGVVSNGPVSVPDLLSQAGLLHHFDVVVTSQGAGVEKPDPRIFAPALEGLRLSPGETLFVGDLYDVDVAGARSAGISAVLIDRLGVASGLDCRVIGSLTELLQLDEFAARN